MMAVKAILWDMDGTLVDSEPLHHAALARAMTAVGFPISVAHAAAYIGIPMVGIHARLVEDTGLTLSYPELAARIAGLLGQAQLPSQAAPSRGFDHGMFIPLMLMFTTRCASESLVAAGLPLRPSF